MATETKETKGGSKAEDRKKLAAGAAAIRAAGKKTTGGKIIPITPSKPEPVVIPDLTQSPEEIVRLRVTVLAGSIGLAIHEDTELEETLAIYDHVKTMQDHVGFMIGDVINFSTAKFGDKYGTAMAQTGRANSTLKGYAEVARKIPPDQRATALSYSHHREVIRLENPEKRAAVLKEASELADKGKALTVQELRRKVNKLKPAKKKPANTSKKKSKNGGKHTEAYVPNAEEQSQIDAAKSVVEEAQAAIADKDLQKLLLKIGTSEKKEWNKLLQPFESLRFHIEKHTGY